MRNLIKADIDRILRRKTIWVILVLMFIILGAVVFSKIGDAPDKSLAFTVAIMQGIGSVGLLIGIVLVLRIYVDDFKSMVFIGVIGRGISRPKLIIAKLLDTLLILVNMYIVSGIFTFILKMIFRVKLSPDMVKFIFLQCGSYILCTTASVVIAAAFFYLTENTTIGVIAYLTAELIIPIVLELVTMFPGIAQYHPERIYFNGASSAMVTDFMIGATGDAILKLLLILVVYIAGAILATILLFRKKELDF